jgi:hypothetical protein
MPGFASDSSNMLDRFKNLTLLHMPHDPSSTKSASFERVSFNRYLLAAQMIKYFGKERDSSQNGGRISFA